MTVVVVVLDLHEPIAHAPGGAVVALDVVGGVGVEDPLQLDVEVGDSSRTAFHGREDLHVIAGAQSRAWPTWPGDRPLGDLRPLRPGLPSRSDRNRSWASPGPCTSSRENLAIGGMMP